MEQTSLNTPGTRSWLHGGYSPYVEQISTDLENMIVLKIDKELLQTPKDVKFVCSDIPPNDSMYWKNCQYGFGLKLLEQCILDLYDSFDDFHILLCDDLNARTASENYTGIPEYFQEIMFQAFVVCVCGLSLIHISEPTRQS